MDPQEIQTYGELAITLAGLTGIIGALQNRREHKLTDRQRCHLFVLLVSAVIVVFYSFLPHWISQHPNIPEDIWIPAVKALLVGHLIAWSIFFWVTKWWKVIFRDFGRVELAVGLLFIPCGVTAVICEIAVTLGHLSSYAPFIYEGVLVLFMTLGLYNFISLLLGADRGSAA